MRSILQLNDKKIPVIVRRHAGARRFVLRVRNNGTVVVTIPKYGSAERATAWVQGHTRWIAEQLSRLPTAPTEISKPRSRQQYILHRAAANRLVKTLLMILNEQYHFRYHKVTIRNQSSRWGSCSQRGNLSFNYKIVFLPAALQEYIVAHELCHLREMNHSARFWKLVSISIPDYSVRRKELRAHRL